jgi:hypothetical protein
MILRLGRRGPGFDSLNPPPFFFEEDRTIQMRVGTDTNRKVWGRRKIALINKWADEVVNFVLCLRVGFAFPSFELPALQWIHILDGLLEHLRAVLLQYIAYRS